jgi:hypothetical protein
MLKKTFCLFILVIAAWMLSIKVHAATEPVEVYLVFDKENYQNNEVMTLTIHVRNYNDLYGFQLDIQKDFNQFTTQTNLNPYLMNEGYIFYSNSQIWVNEVNDDIASYLVSKDLSFDEGYQYSEGYTALATIKLVALQNIINPYQLFKITSTLDDLTFDNFNMVLKLSDSNANPIAYTVIQAPEVPLIPPVITLNPGIDTISIGSIHTDAHINVIYAGAFEVIVDNQVNTQALGSYAISYRVIYGDQEMVIVRYVHVIEKQKVVIFSIVPTVTTLPIGGKFENKGCSVNIDGITMPCDVLSSNINSSQTGAYQVIYGVTYQDVTYTHTLYVFVFKIFQDVLFPNKEEVFYL